MSGLYTTSLHCCIYRHGVVLRTGMSWLSALQKYNIIYTTCQNSSILIKLSFYLQDRFSFPKEFSVRYQQLSLICTGRKIWAYIMTFIFADIPSYFWISRHCSLSNTTIICVVVCYNMHSITKYNQYVYRGCIRWWTVPVYITTSDYLKGISELASDSSI
jgi:hypothetical protein